MDPSRALLIALNRCETLSRDSICRLAPHLELLREDRMGAAELSQTSKVTPRQLERALDARSSAEETAECEQRRAQSLGFEILTTLDPTYPTPLRDLELPPPVVYVEGELPRRQGFSIVGSRPADAYGLEAAELFSRVLSATGLAIVSGLARGIDGCAHENAVDVEGGRSIAVLACGLDHTYPLQHRPCAVVWQPAARDLRIPSGHETHRSQLSHSQPADRRARLWVSRGAGHRPLRLADHGSAWRSISAATSSQCQAVSSTAVPRGPTP